MAERLIIDAGGGQDELPLIQHALMLLWNQASDQAGGLPPRLGLGLYRQQEGGAAALLSDHADRVMAAVAPELGRQAVVELLFRALTDINAEGHGIRRPQRFDRLVAVTGGDREMLRRLIEAFRPEGVSFLTPYPPAAIEDATVIDISHEALIRCWRRIADPKDGWLQREFQDGLVWRSLLAPAKSFEKNPKHVLSPALTEDRGRWLEGRPPAWCERYGGGWQRVTDLMQASEAAAARARQRDTWRRRASWAPMLVLAGIGLWMAADRGWTAWQDRQRAETWREAATTAAAGKASEPVKDCDDCPEMVVLPPGTFLMGSPESDTDAEKDERPQHPVTIGEPFAISRYEVTKAEYAAFVEATYPRGNGCYIWTGREWRFNANADWREPGFAQTDRDPVACVGWLDAQAYVEWLSGKSGQRYRLATEAEWEYAARAGTTTRYATGDTMAEKDAKFGQNPGKTTPVGSYPPNPWGLSDMHGNLWEWTEDCYNDNYDGVPSNGRASVEGDCTDRVERGGAWNDLPGNLRSAARSRVGPAFRGDNLGFRVSRTITPKTLRFTSWGFKGAKPLWFILTLEMTVNDRGPIDNVRRTAPALRWRLCTNSCYGSCQQSKGFRAQKFLLGDRMQSTTLDVLERLIEATYSGVRQSALRQANLGIEKLRFFFRLAIDLGYLDLLRYEHAARSLDEVGRHGLFNQIASFDALVAAAPRAVKCKAGMLCSAIVPRPVKQAGATRATAG